MKFLVAPESSSAVVSALLCEEWIYDRIVIDFRADIYTFVWSLLLIKAELIRRRENPACLLIEKPLVLFLRW